MRTVVINIYDFNELSEKAKENAISNEDISFEYQLIYDEVNETIKQFNNVFGLKSGLHSWFDFRTDNIDDDILELKGLRLRTYLINNFYSQIYTNKYINHKGNLLPICPQQYHPMRRYRLINEGQNKGLYSISYYSNLNISKDCPLTGVCYDNIILEEIYNFIENYRNYQSADFTTFEDLMGYCFDNIKKCVEKEIEYRESREGIKEYLENNNHYEFDIEGNII